VVFENKKNSAASKDNSETIREEVVEENSSSSDDYWGLNEKTESDKKSSSNKDSQKTEKKKKKLFDFSFLTSFDEESDTEASNETDSEVTNSMSTFEFDDNSERRVICWGDSMTEGTGGGDVTYPSTLEKISGAEVLNYGVFNETTRDIAARSGAKPQFVVAESAVTIPADTTPIVLNTAGEDGQWPGICIFGTAGMNPAMVGNVEGTFYHDDVTGLKMFKRNTPGEAVTLPVGTPVTTFASKDHKEGDILIIWSGNNENPQTAEAINDTIYWQKEIIKQSGTEDYAIISLTTKAMLPQIDLINEMFKNEYGEHYIDLRAYVLGDMISDAGINPTDADKMYLANGFVPPSLMDTDEIHGNSTFYEYAGKFIYKELQRMGYLK